MVAPARTARVVLLAGIGAGLANLVVLPATQPDQLGLATAVYTAAAEAALAGEPFYDVAPPDLPGYTFIYPPVVVLGFLPAGLLGEPLVTYAVQTAVTVVAGLALARLLVDVVERVGVGLSRLDRALVAGYVLLSVHTAPTMVNGQVNVVLGLGLAVGLVAADRGRPGLGGAALGLVATVKVFPAAVGAYLLRRRDWHAVAVATATGLGLLALGALAFGMDTTVTFFTAVLPGETQPGALAADPTAHDYLTVRRQLAVLVPWAPAAWLPVLGVAVVAPLVALSYRRITTQVDRLLAILATVVGTLLVLPLEGLYFPLVFFPLVPLLYLVPAGRTRQVLVAGTLASMVSVTPLGVRAAVETGLFGPLGPTLESLTMPVFRVILPPTVGMWLLVSAAIHWQWWGRHAVATGHPALAPVCADRDD